MNNILNIDNTKGMKGINDENITKDLPSINDYWGS